MYRPLIAAACAALFVLAGCQSEPQPAPATTPAPAQPAAQTAPPPPPQAKPKFAVAWSHYTGWEPWGYAEHAGILKRHAERHGVEIELTLVPDYIESINLYTAGKFQACVMTNMDALTIPALGGVDSEALLIGDYSNGNDGVVARNASSIAELRGRSVNLVELSVSHYLLARALEMNGMAEADLKLINTSDADIAAVFSADPNGAAVTWNPPLAQALKAPGAQLIFDSSKIPGEILDLLIVRTDAAPAFKRAMAGAWFEVLAILMTPGPERDQAVAWMAQSAGGTVEEFEAQLRTTALYTDAAQMLAFAQSAELKQTMDRVRQFSFAKGLYGDGAATADQVGIAFADGTVLGDAGNVRLRFPTEIVEAASRGEL